MPLQQFVVLNLNFPILRHDGRWKKHVNAWWMEISLVLDANVLLVKPFSSCSSHYYNPRKTCPDLENFGYLPQWLNQFVHVCCLFLLHLKLLSSSYWFTVHLCLQVLLFLQAKTKEEHAEAQMIVHHRPETLQVSSSVDCDFRNQ